MAMRTVPIPTLPAPDRGYMKGPPPPPLPKKDVQIAPHGASAQGNGGQARVEAYKQSTPERLAATTRGEDYKPLPGVRDDCMTCFVRGVQACPEHREQKVVFKNESWAPAAPKQAVERLKRIPEPPIPLVEPLFGWDVVIREKPRHGSCSCFDCMDTVKYVRPDGVMIRRVSGHCYWRVEHPAYGLLQDYSAPPEDPLLLMAWADQKIPRLGPEDLEAVRRRRRQEALAELMRRNDT